MRSERITSLPHDKSLLHTPAIFLPSLWKNLLPGFRQDPISIRVDPKKAFAYCKCLVYTVVMPANPPKLYLPAISPAAPGALYDQIIAGVKRQISEGHLTPGTALPSFRQLAADLLVSVITVKRAYEELEHEGIIFRKQGLGTYVAERGDAICRAAKLDHARKLIQQAMQEAQDAGLTAPELPKFFLDILNSNSNTEPLT
jgi:GntR family transcriptional regulator